MAPVNGPADQAVFANVVAAAAHTHGVAATAGPQVLLAGPGHPAVAVADVYPAGSPQDASTSALIRTLRGAVIPQALHGSQRHVPSVANLEQFRRRLGIPDGPEARVQRTALDQLG